jgi:ParB/RepB/Spo0J family partition protein
MTEDTITQLDVDHLHESPFNPRKIFDDTSLAELATDIKAQGRVLQPLLVRPRVPPLFASASQADPAAACGHEIVFGHRRYRAALLAGLPTVPCMVRALTDDEARPAQISENLQRQDVHPIEEAEGYQALIDDTSGPARHTADTIAEQFGKSRSYVYGRLKLLQASARHYGVEAAPTPALAARAPIGAEVKYRDPATGSTWSGRGLQPKWVKSALADGKTLADFEQPPGKSKGKGQKDDAGDAGGSGAKP